jgi:hypothetical protein
MELSIAEAAVNREVVYLSHWYRHEADKEKGNQKIELLAE